MSATPTPAEWKAILLQAEPHAKPWIVDGFADALPELCEKFEINTKLRQSHFIAQCAHESDHFRTTVEYASGAAYEGRKDLGNTHAGDGKKFKGRGLIQLTGRFNYQKAAQEFKQPFVDDPELVMRFPWAASVSAWFWRTFDLNTIADTDDVRAVTRRVNGGLNGLDSRVAALSSTKKALA